MNLAYTWAEKHPKECPKCGTGRIYPLKQAATRDGKPTWICEPCSHRWVDFPIVKDHDPKGAEGEKKTPLHLLPPVFMAATAWVLKLGAKKYGPWNWRKSKVESQTYVGAIRRHLDAWQDGEDIDAESGQSHLASVAACVAILLDAEAAGTLLDNRPPKINKEKS